MNYIPPRTTGPMPHRPSAMMQQPMQPQGMPQMPMQAMGQPMQQPGIMGLLRGGGMQGGGRMFGHNANVNRF